MTDLIGKEGELRFTVEVKRAATGKVETFEMVGKIGDSEKQIGDENGSDTQHSS